MKCKNAFEGKLCGADLEPSAKFCSTCGAVTKDEVNSALCPNCANTVKPIDKFCSKCGGKIDPNLFVPKQYSCKGIHEGKVCGANLSIDDKFCSNCGNATESREIPDDKTVTGKQKTDTTREIDPSRSRSSKSDLQLSSSDDSHSDISKTNKKMIQSHGMQNLKERQSKKVTGSDQMKVKVNSESDTGDERAHNDQQSDKRLPKSNDDQETTQEETKSNDEKRKKKPRVRKKKPKKSNEQQKSETEDNMVQSDDKIDETHQHSKDSSRTVKQEATVDIKQNEGKRRKKNKAKGPEKESGNTVNKRISDSEDPKGEENANNKGKSDEQHHQSNTEKNIVVYERISDPEEANGEENMHIDGKSDRQHDTSDNDEDIDQQRISDYKGSNEEDTVHTDEMHHTSDDDKDLSQFKISDSEDSNEKDTLQKEGNSDKMHHISDDDKDIFQLSIADSENSNGEDNVHSEGKSVKMHHTSDNDKDVVQQGMSGNETGEHTRRQFDKEGYNSKDDEGTLPTVMPGNGIREETENTNIQTDKEGDSPGDDKGTLTTEEHCIEERQNIRRSERVKTSYYHWKKNENYNSKGTASLVDGPIIKKGNKYEDHKVTEQKSVKSSSQKIAKYKEESKQSPHGHVESGYTENVKVCFHVVVSPSLRQSGGKVAVLREKDPSRYYLFKKRELNDLDPGYAEYEGMFTVKRHQNITTFRYSYCVVHTEGEVREYIPNTQFRQLVILSNTNNEVFHQYDGVVRSKQDKEKKRWRITKIFISLAGFESTDSYTDILKNDSQIAISTFLPKLRIFESNATAEIGEQLLLTVRKIMDDTKKHYMWPQTTWTSEIDFKTQSRKVLQQYINECLEKLVEYIKKRKEDQVLLVSCAATILLLHDEYQLSLNPTQIISLCDLFLPILTENQTRCIDFENVEHNFKVNIPTLQSALLQFMKGIAVKGKDPSWLKCVPLYHFLSRQCNPFQQIPPYVNHSDAVPSWWGITNFKTELTYFQRSEWNRSPNDVIEALEPYFDIDFLLPRVIMASMNLKRLLEMDFSKIRPEITLAVFSCFMKSSLMSQKSIKEFKELFFKMESIMSNLNERYQSYEDAKRSFHIAQDLMTICINQERVSRVPVLEITDLCIALSGVVFHSIDCLKKAIDRSRIEDDLSYFHVLKEWICKRMLQCQITDLLSNLQSWNSALRVRIPDGWLKLDYLKSVNDSLHTFLNNLTHHQEEQLIDAYFHDFEVFDDTLKNILTKYTYQAIQKRKSVELRVEDYEKYREILPSVFERNLDIENLKDGHQCLMYSLTWPPFATFLEMFNDQQFFVSLNENCQKWIRKFIDVLKAVCDGICDGTVSVNDLRFILKNLENFRSVVRQLNEVTINMDNFESIIQTRQKEIEKYDEVADHVEKLNRVCERYLDNLDILEEKHTNQDSMDPVKLNDICKIQSQGQINITAYEPTIVAFEIPETLLGVLPLLISCYDSLLFKKIWKKTGTILLTKKNRRLTIEEVFSEMWTPSYKQWKLLQEKLIKGRIQLSEYEEFFQNTQIEELRRECNLLGEKNGYTDWIEQRLAELEQYKFIHRCSSAANLIHDIVTVYGITGNFKDIQNVREQVKNKEAFFVKVDATSEVYRTLSSIDYLHEDCLKAFIECKELIEWIRETMKSGLTDLKVFVELASISAGEGDLEIDKVNRLQSATSGYAPLIFINTLEKIDEKTLLSKCKDIWKNLSENNELPTQLRATNLQLEWFKVITQTHGAVEVTSLFQAEEINSNGIYVIGNHAKCWNSKKPTLAEVLALKVYDMKGKTRVGQAKEKSYNYDQLHDLQSRLMLVAGKGKAGQGKRKTDQGKDDIDRFMAILDSVTRLSHIYIKLVSKGCVLFSQWHVKIYCDKGRQACLIVSFGHGQNKTLLKGRIEEHEDVSTVIPLLAKFLEDSHEKWLKYIDDKRDKYYYLNYFSIDQMVFLQQELVKMGTKEIPSDLVYPLLSAIKQDCNQDDLERAMTNAKKGMSNGSESSDDEDESQSVVTAEKPIEYDEHQLNFIESMETAGFNTELAKEALNHVSPSEDMIPEGVNWCMENRDNSLFTKKLADDVPFQGRSFMGWTKTDQSLATVTSHLVQKTGAGTKENGFSVLIGALEEIRRLFLTTVSSSVSDYLSVEHLGCILERLSEQETNPMKCKVSPVEVKRELLPGFRYEEPNLVVCPQRDVYNFALSMYTNDFKSPLPQSDEVLLCSRETTLDQIEIFIRRALYSEEEKNYCLLNADLLDYDISEKGTKFLEDHMKIAEASKKKSYRLIIICSNENEYKARIVASLDKFRRQMFVAGVDIVEKYLLNKFIVESSPQGNSPASLVDFDRSSVRVIRSCRGGLGKSLYKSRMVDSLKEQLPNIDRIQSIDIVIPLHEKRIDVDKMMEIFIQKTLPPDCNEPRIIHLDVSHEVQEGVDAVLFQLLILGTLENSSGLIWRKSPLDYYIIETMPAMVKSTDSQECRFCFLHHCLNILPTLECRSPTETYQILMSGKSSTDKEILFDDIEFHSETFQRPYQYLKRQDTHTAFDDVNPSVSEDDHLTCLKVLLRHCGLNDPSWSEIYHFVSFLDKQLQDFEKSNFCSDAARESLPGFAEFVLRFLIQMSKDFATRSLKVSEESPLAILEKQMSNVSDETVQNPGNEDGLIQLYQLRRTWETSPHPYIFFNPDQSMTFLGFYIDGNCNLRDQRTKAILEENIMTPNLRRALKTNGVDLTENFDQLKRQEKLNKICRIMGVQYHDPDETYELTTDNVKKILAIYMRFKCDIPVVIMGETGCGKTTLIKFMCALQRPAGVTSKNMILMKVHGGTKASDIVRMVRKSEKIADLNSQNHRSMFTVLFFDEANTTEAIGLIKEIMCDKCIEGRPIKLHEKLKIVAACNPYRKHSDELIKRLEQSGLGYHVDANHTTDKLGRVPMRRLVYRVQPLPQSMLPLVWDFGQLDKEIEEIYIVQMVTRYVKGKNFPDLIEYKTVLSRILTESQEFMRNQKDECSFVSLRDVERVLDVMFWFYSQCVENKPLFLKIREYEDEDIEKKRELFDENKPKPLRNADNINENDEESESLDSEQNYIQVLDDITRCLVLAIGVCYHACLKDRKAYRDKIAQYFQSPLHLPEGPDDIEQEINRCQTVFLDSIRDLAPNIARNQALRENVFAIFVCIELRIPLFLVGKPGSSKSLAKAIIADAMQGRLSKYAFFKDYKQVQMMSFQCSPLSVPEGIVGTFRQCAAYQKDKNLDEFVSVVVLDEIGLAEDSPRMPLKTLHPLLETGSPDDEKVDQYKKVGFIGISNWALDPAKMNRGIFVQRYVPDINELKESAEGICLTDHEVLERIRKFIPGLATSYLEVFDAASSKMREFFGLRDFYSLIKMVYAFAKKSCRKPTRQQLIHSVLRNFGGLEGVHPVEIFNKNMAEVRIARKSKDDPDCTSAGMIKACLTGSTDTSCDNRYLLLLTENYGALPILQLEQFNLQNAHTIFGSSFPNDQEYTQICRNINQIKVCMESGITVILLNLENLYESLYDALNQYYFELGGDRYVDLGLGTHRVKCRVRPEFRLIVVAEKRVVYEKFPIPLINRLEKHCLSTQTVLNVKQLELTKSLQAWVKHFVKTKNEMKMMMKRKEQERKVEDCFIGYNADTCATIILHTWKTNEDDADIPAIAQELLRDAKSILLWCATPSVVLQHGMNDEYAIYFHEQHHESLADYLNSMLSQCNENSHYAQITTNSKLLVESDVVKLCKDMENIHIVPDNAFLLTLHLFDTEQQFCMKIRSCFENSIFPDYLLIVQCECGDKYADLIACARYAVQGEIQQMQQRTIQENDLQLIEKIHVVFLIQLPGISGSSFGGFQCGKWQSVHIDDLFPAPNGMPALIDMCDKSINELFVSSLPISRTTNPANVRLDQKQKQRSCFDLNQILRNCIQPALAKIEDHADDLMRRTDRLRILLDFLQQYPVDTAHDGNIGQEDEDVKVCQANQQRKEMLLSGISKHFTRLLYEKEQKSARPTSANWLFTEAANLETGNNAGTFRKLAIQYLEAKIIPVMAKVIAFIDTNRNLDILVRHEPHAWQTELFLKTLNLAELDQLNFTDSDSSAMKQDQISKVKTTSLLGNAFDSYIPFSWILYEQTELLLKKHLDENDIQESQNDCIQKTVDILKSFGIGRLVDEMDVIDKQQFICDYIKDFVYMAHPVKSESEHQLIWQTVKAGYKCIGSDDNHEILSAICQCHILFKLNGARYKHLSLVVSVFPKCCDEISDMQQKKPNFELVTDSEMTLDVFALHILLRKLEPQKGVLEDSTTRMQWLRNVCDYRLIVERIFSHLRQRIETVQHNYGERCEKGLVTIRHQWTKVMILKLFVEHVCNGSPREQTEIENCLPFWVILGSKADMKSIKTFITVENFLKNRNKAVLKDYFGQMADCMVCEKPIESAPVTLPCSTRHVLCAACFYQTVSFKEFECPDCGTEFPADFNPEEAQNREKILKFNDFRTRINKFFMEVISQMSFAEGSSPSTDVIEKIMSYVTGSGKSKSAERIVTKELTVFHDTIDPTPVVRSFLLQHMMLMSGDHWEKHLSIYFQQTSELVEGHGPVEKLKLCLLVMFCMEDSMYQQFSKVDENMIDVATRLADEACSEVGTEQPFLKTIKNICKTRFTLSVTATHLHRLFTSTFTTVSQGLQRLFYSASRLCDDSGTNDWPRRFFVKHLCRTYGIDSYQRILRESDEGYLRWVRLPEMDAENLRGCQDRYVVCGKEYNQFRDAFLTMEASSQIDDLAKGIIDIIKTAGNWNSRIKMLLAFHRQNTIKIIHPGPACNDEKLPVIIKAIEGQETVRNKDLFRDILLNQLWRSDADISDRMDVSQQNTACLLTHFLLVMSEIPGQTTLVTPLVEIALRPENMTNAFLPTMPQDDIDEIEQAILSATNHLENPKFYKCPNGHRYLIGNCGRPWIKQKCNVCNEGIGGVVHNLDEGNLQDDGNDTTETGHLLGRADESNVVTVPERNLNRASFSIVRLLLHLAMYSGTKSNSEAVCQLIKPNIEASDVCGYILAHIKLDLQSIQRVLGKSNDEVYLFMHYILADIVNKHNMNVIGENCAPNMCGLTNKEGRVQWEREFVGRYINPVVDDIESILDSCNHKLVNDKRLGFNALLRVIYEIDSSSDIQHKEDLHYHPSSWQYRREINIDLFSQMLNTSKEECKTLMYFFQEEHHLRAIRFVPSILRLHKILIHKYSRQLDREEAENLNISEVRMQIERERRYEDFDHLFEDFKTAWHCIRQSLDNFLLSVDGTFVKVKKELCRVQIDDNTPISYLLPTTKGSGLISYALLYFLIKKQNTFLQSLSSHNLPEVNIRDISHAHLISYHPEKDLLPMAMASCNYSFEIGKDAQIEYNFKDLEIQIMDKFLFSKSTIKIKEIETFTYRAEATNAVVFKTLLQKIPQVRLKPTVKVQIISEVLQKTLPVICDSIDRLDIAISYMIPVCSDSEAMLHEFMVGTLKMENPIPSQKAEQISKFKHTMSLWITLAHERGKLLAKYNKDTFEWVSDNLKEPMTEEQTSIIKNLLDKLPVEHLDSLVELLFECIVLRMDIPENIDDEDFYDSSGVSLRDTLIGYIDATPYEEDFKIEETLMTTISKFPSEINTPEIVLTTHAVAVWNLANTACKARQSQRL